MKMVLCVIGYKLGIGGFFGVNYLVKVFGFSFFFEFWIMCIIMIVLKEGLSYVVEDVWL